MIKMCAMNDEFRRIELNEKMVEVECLLDFWLTRHHSFVLFVFPAFVAFYFSLNIVPFNKFFIFFVN